MEDQLNLSSGSGFVETSFTLPETFSLDAPVFRSVTVLPAVSEADGIHNRPAEPADAFADIYEKRISSFFSFDVMDDVFGLQSQPAAPRQGQDELALVPPLPAGFKRVENMPLRMPALDALRAIDAFFMTSEDTQCSFVPRLLQLYGLAYRLGKMCSFHISVVSPYPGATTLELEVNRLSGCYTAFIMVYNDICRFVHRQGIAASPALRPLPPAPPAVTFADLGTCCCKDTHGRTVSLTRDSGCFASRFAGLSPPPEGLEEGVAASCFEEARQWFFRYHDDKISLKFPQSLEGVRNMLLSARADLRDAAAMFLLGTASDKSISVYLSRHAIPVIFEALSSLTDCKDSRAAVMLLRTLQVLSSTCGDEVLQHCASANLALYVDLLKFYCHGPVSVSGDVARQVLTNVEYLFSSSAVQK